MSTDEYVPHESYVRHRYVSGEADLHSTPEWEGGAEFDRFIARVRREAKAEGWADCERSLHRWFNDSFAGDEPPRNPYRATETGDNDDHR